MSRALELGLLPLVHGAAEPKAALDAQVFFWRTQGGTEVDFVVYGEQGIQAFEVKNAGTIRRRDLRSLRASREDYPEAEAAVLYRGRERLRIDDVRCVPVDEFLRSVTPNRPLVGDL